MNDGEDSSSTLIDEPPGETLGELAERDGERRRKRRMIIGFTFVGLLALVVGGIAFWFVSNARGAMDTANEAMAEFVGGDLDSSYASFDERCGQFEKEDFEPLIDLIEGASYNLKHIRIDKITGQPNRAVASGTIEPLVEFSQVQVVLFEFDAGWQACGIHLYP